jgi:hypothetical protein
MTKVYLARDYIEEHSPPASGKWDGEQLRHARVVLRNYLVFRSFGLGVWLGC